MTNGIHRWNIVRQRCITCPVLLHPLYDVTLSHLSSTSTKIASRKQVISFEKNISDNVITKTIAVRNREEAKKINRCVEDESIKLDLEITLNHIYQEQLSHFVPKKDSGIEGNKTFDIMSFIKERLLPLQQDVEKFHKKVASLDDAIKQKDKAIKGYKILEDKHTQESDKIDKMEKNITENVSNVIKSDMEKVLGKLEAVGRLEQILTQMRGYQLGHRLAEENTTPGSSETGSRQGDEHSYHSENSSTYLKKQNSSVSESISSEENYRPKSSSSMSGISLVHCYFINASSNIYLIR